MRAGGNFKKELYTLSFIAGCSITDLCTESIPFSRLMYGRRV